VSCDGRARSEDVEGLEKQTRESRRATHRDKAVYIYYLAEGSLF
jgi:hypothetical protein